MYTQDQIDRLAARLKDSPPVPKVLTKSEAIKKLAPSIRAMQAHGYNLEQIADMMKADGFSISAKTLARHLRGQRTVTGNGKPSAGSRNRHTAGSTGEPASIPPTARLPTAA